LRLLCTHSLEMALQWLIQHLGIQKQQRA
jgi:hypothetical protein